MKTLRRLLFFVLVLGVLGLGTLAGTSYYYGGDDGMGCARCHEIRPMVDAWAASSHRRRAVQGLPRQLLLGRPAHAREEPLARVAPLARRDAGADPHPPPGRLAARRALRRLPPPGAGRLGERPARGAVRRPLHQPRAQRRPAAHGRLPALPRHALRGRHPGPRHPARPEGAVDVRQGGVRRPARRALPGLPLRPPQGRAPRAAERPRARGRPGAGDRPTLARPLRPPRPRARGPRPAPDAADEGRRAAREGEPRPAAGALLPVPRAPGGDAGLLRRRPNPGGRARGPELPGLPREARPDDARVLRGLPPAPLELRDRRGDDGHDLQVARQPARRPPGGVPRLPPEGRAEEADGAGNAPARPARG